MSGETISAAILTIASVICATAFVAAVYPPILGASAPVIRTVDNLGDRITTDIKIIHEAYDSEENETYIWIKNVGTQQLSGNVIENSDIFFGEEGNFIRLAYNESGGSHNWNYIIENGGDSRWDKGETIRITVQTPLIPGFEYFVKFIAYNGISDTDYFTV